MCDAGCAVAVAEGVGASVDVDPVEHGWVVGYCRYETAFGWGAVVVGVLDIEAVEGVEGGCWVVLARWEGDVVFGILGDDPDLDSDRCVSYRVWLLGRKRYWVWMVWRRGIGD